MRKIRILLLITDLERGGTPLRIARLACGLRAAGLETHVGCLAPAGPISRQLDAAGIPTFACDARGPRDFVALWRLGQHVRRVSPDLIHATLTHANVAARVIGRLHGIPVVTSTATIEVERRWHAWAERLTRWLDHGQIVISQAVAEHVRRVFRYRPEKVFIVPPAIELPAATAADRADIRAELGISDSEFVMLWAGRLDPVKRIDLVLDCAAHLREMPVRFLIAGDGPQREQVERALRGGPRAPVQWLGWRDDLDGLIAAADVLLFPSRTEGMPNVVLQAMAGGLAVVGSDIPALRELSGPDERLLLVRLPDADSAAGAALAAAVLSLRDDPQRRQALADRARNWAAAHLDPGRTVAAVIGVYERILESRRGGRRS